MCHEVVCSRVLPVHPGDRLQLEGIVLEASRFINEDLCREQGSTATLVTFTNSQAINQSWQLNNIFKGIKTTGPIKL